MRHPKCLSPYFGRVLYTHGTGTDRPLSIIRLGYVDHPYGEDYRQWAPFALLPLWNARGEPDGGLFADGDAEHCVDGGTRCVEVFWPEGWRAYNRTRPLNPAWHGSLAEDKRDQTGLYFRRARYYDPHTGRFTQPDPIGLAGGLNLYGYEGGNPLNLSDPFGLMPCDPPGSCVAQGVVIGGTLGAVAGGVVAGGCTVGSGGTCALGGPGIISFFSSGGAAFGGLVGTLVEADIGDDLAVEMRDWQRRAIAWGLSVITSVIPGVDEGEGGEIERLKRCQEGEQVQEDVRKDEDGPEQEPPDEY